MEYLFTILVLAVAVAVIVAVSKRIASHTFKCKHCSGEFNVRWSKIIVTEHYNNEYMLVCPYCNTKDWCAAQTKNNQ